MDQKKTLRPGNGVAARLILPLVLLSVAGRSVAQAPDRITFCDKKYEYAPGKDSITLFLKLDGNSRDGMTADRMKKCLEIKEDGVEIPHGVAVVREVVSGQRIPSGYTFSVLVDLTVPQEDKQQLYKAVGILVESAPDSCVYISFFGDKVSGSEMVTKDNYSGFRSKFMENAGSKCFYGALYAKLAEFSTAKAVLEDAVRADEDYRKNPDIQRRAMEVTDGQKNMLFVFTEGRNRPADEQIDFISVTEYDADVIPRVYAFYCTGRDEVDKSVINTLKGVTAPRDWDGNIIEGRMGEYCEADDMQKVLQSFNKVVEDAKYDFAYTYPATRGKVYSGRTDYSAEWNGVEAGHGSFSIGSPEHPWPVRHEDAGDTAAKYAVAALVTLLSIALFFLVMKALIPWVKSKAFAAKYYRKYEPEANVNVRRCTYCKQPILPGQMIVAKCSHLTHVNCWQQNGFKCAEYGQNCKSGIQEHVDGKDIFTMAALRDCRLTIMGIIAGLVCWVIYELSGRGGFGGIARTMTGWFFPEGGLHDDCATKVSAFLMTGLLLGLFLSLIFRYNDEYRTKTLGIYMKIAGLSLFSALVGFASFALGAIIFCLLLSVAGTTYIPWFCSLPAYLLFSVCFSLSLTVKSSIPVRSALLGGLCSAAIGFIVLYFASSGYGWMNMLLDFVIYGGGLGASLVTVRMLAEKYFLVIRNGVKEGQRIPVHKWMNATGGGNTVTIGMTGDCEIQMNWEKSNKVAKEHAVLYIDPEKHLPMLKPLVSGVIYNARAELAAGKPSVLSNNDTFKVGDTIFQYVETD